MNEADYWRALRGALRHLYDPAALRQNPLNGLLNAQAGALGLQELLMDAVHGLSPARGTSVQSDARRTHQILLHRYVEQFSQDEVAASLGLSARQLRRQEQLAIRTLGEYLRERYSLSVTPDLPDTPGVPEVEGRSVAEQDTDMATSADEQYREDLEWLHQAAPLEYLDIGELITGVLQTLEPLFQELNLSVQSPPSSDMPRVAVNAMATRQALMITLTTVARGAAGKGLSVATATHQNEVQIEIQPVEEGGKLSLEVGEDLIMAQRLLALSGGSLSLHNREEEGELYPPNDAAVVTLTLPLAQPATVLIIDDNQDALQLFQRYLTGTRFYPIVTRDPVEGLALAQGFVPQVILLDVMLPGMDGWEVLSRLRRHPATEQIPVIICTILPEEQLARALGASGFLRKPLARDDLLSALETMDARLI